MKRLLLIATLFILMTVSYAAQESRPSDNYIGIDVSDDCSISRIWIDLSTLKPNYKKGDTLEIFAAIGNLRNEHKIIWKLSKGRIIKGQNTLLIKVDSRNVKGKFITATIELRQKHSFFGNKCRTTENITISLQRL